MEGSSHARMLHARHTYHLWSAYSRTTTVARSSHRLFRVCFCVLCSLGQAATGPGYANFGFVGLDAFVFFGGVYGQRLNAIFGLDRAAAAIYSRGG